MVALEVVLGSNRLDNFSLVLTDFERTLVRLFEKRSDEQRFFAEVKNECIKRGIPVRVLKAAGESPYLLWTRAYRWMARYGNSLDAEKMYHAFTRSAIKYEMEAAQSVRLFAEVVPVLEKLKTAGIPVGIVSNNGTDAVKQILTRNQVFREGDQNSLVDFVIGRKFQHEMVGKLKPKPNLLVEALERSNCDPSTALLVGDSVDDMKAGKAAGVRLRVGVLEHSTATKRQLRRAGARLVLQRFGDLLPLVPGGDVSRVH